MSVRDSRAVPYGWIEISELALQRLRRELEDGLKGVVDEMGVLAIHSGYADYFFPGTSVLQSRPRYLFFICWNFLWLAAEGAKPSNIRRMKEEADMWVTGQLFKSYSRSRGGVSGEGIIGVDLYQNDPPRLPVQSPDFIYWTALRRWGFYGSSAARDRGRLFRYWRAGAVVRAGEGADPTKDEAVADDSLAEFNVPPVPTEWRDDDHDGLDFALTNVEAWWLLERLQTLEPVTEGPCLLAKAASLAADESPSLISRFPWDDPLLLDAANTAGQHDRLMRAKHASHLAWYVRAIYGGLVEWVVESQITASAGPPLRHYRDQLSTLVNDTPVRDSAIMLSLDALYADVSRIPARLRNLLSEVQKGLVRAATGELAEAVFINDDFHRIFERVERQRKGSRARLPRTEQGAARRAGFRANTVGVYPIDYRWNVVRDLLSDLHFGLSRT